MKTASRKAFFIAALVCFSRAERGTNRERTQAACLVASAAVYCRLSEDEVMTFISCQS
jgi:hypothetical protein